MFKYYKLHEWCLNTVGRGLQSRNCDCTLMMVDATVQSSEQEEQDMEPDMEPNKWWCNVWIVVEGDLYGRFKFYGPFNNHADATTFGDSLIGYNIIIRLIPPEAET